MPRRTPAASAARPAQVLGYALVDGQDGYRLDTVGVYCAAPAVLQTWPLAELLRQLTGGEAISVPALRVEFRDAAREAIEPAQRAKYGDR